MKGQVR